MSDAGSSNLPVRPTRLLGRERDIATVRQMMSDSRLVTVTAAGGPGKTRLAIAIGEAELPHRHGGVWFADLTAVARGTEVTSAIAASLGLVADGPDRTALVIGYPADRQALVILDNCEHVIDECAEFADRFLRAAGSSSLLATSREPLDIDVERTLALPPLPSDTPDSPGVRLFMDRACAVKADFAMNETSAATIAEICLRLDGLPIAVEAQELARRCQQTQRRHVFRGAGPRARQRRRSGARGCRRRPRCLLRSGIGTVARKARS